MSVSIGSCSDLGDTCGVHGQEGFSSQGVSEIKEGFQLLRASGMSTVQGYGSS